MSKRKRDYTNKQCEESINRRNERQAMNKFQWTGLDAFAHSWDDAPVRISDPSSVIVVSSSNMDSLVKAWLNYRDCQEYERLKQCVINLNLSGIEDSVTMSHLWKQIEEIKNRHGGMPPKI